MGELARQYRICKLCKMPEGMMTVVLTMIREIEVLKLRLSEYEKPWVEDRPSKYDELIKVAHPMVTGDHARWALAARLVGAKHSKYALIGLVNFLLKGFEEAGTDTGFGKEGF